MFALFKYNENMNSIILFINAIYFSFASYNNCENVALLYLSKRS